MSPLQCDRCSLCLTAKQYVAGIGNPIHPRLMVIGEAPGAEEDRIGIPFVGPAGNCLEEILSKLVTGDDIYITNVVKHRPPNNRTPLPSEIIACWSWLDEEITRIQPQHILCCGKTAYTKLSIQAGINPKPSGFRSTSFLFRDIPVMATWHPSYVIRNGDPHDPLSCAAKLASDIAQDITQLLG